MPAVLADLSIASRWTLPMTSRDEVLEHHTLIVRDGKILDLLPSAAAAERYAATVHVQRPRHLLLPGLVNAHACIAPSAGRAHRPELLRDETLLGIAAMIRTGTTCFGAMGGCPDESARAAAAQGMRVRIGIPIAETPSAWAASAAEYLTRALSLRDEYRGHPSIATAFAPAASPGISDATFTRIATLADELDAGIVLGLHESSSEVQESLAQHGLRPIERLRSLGLLTPALTALHMTHVDARDIEAAQHGGVAIALCPKSSLYAGQGPPPVAAWASTGLRLSVGTGSGEPAGDHNLWSEVLLLALLARTPVAAGSRLDAWDALAAATRGGAAALGLDAELGTLEIGKWADLCCVEAMPAPRYPAATLVTALVFDGSRGRVGDVWIAGRHLLNAGAFTRLDWQELAARVDASTGLSTEGHSS